MTNTATITAALTSTEYAALSPDIVIDAGGRDSTALRAALVLADHVLIPLQPRSFDLWALNDMTGSNSSVFENIFFSMTVRNFS